MYTLRISEADPYLGETVGVENTWMSCTACSQWGSGGCKDSVSGCSAEAQIAYRSQTEGLENIWDERKRRSFSTSADMRAFSRISILG